MRLRLRHVGARHLADIEAVAGLPQRFAEHADVAALHLQDCNSPQHVHVGGGGVEQHRLLDDAQRLARREHLALGRAGAVAGLEAVEQRLLDVHADVARLGGALQLRAGRCGIVLVYCLPMLAVALARGR